ncbi:hypothetical protein ACQRIU_005087 [Beauveria bassiana]
MSCDSTALTETKAHPKRPPPSSIHRDSPSSSSSSRNAPWQVSIAGGVNRLIGAKTYLSSPLPRPSSPPLLQSELISNHRAQFVQSLLDALTTSPQLLLYAYF